jgi:hypothetical protein
MPPGLAGVQRHRIEGAATWSVGRPLRGLAKRARQPRGERSAGPEVPTSLPACFGREPGRDSAVGRSFDADRPQQPPDRRARSSSMAPTARSVPPIW